MRFSGTGAAVSFHVTASPVPARVLDAASRYTGAPDDAAMSALAERTAAEPLFV
jgi:hypothetical protein